MNDVSFPQMAQDAHDSAPEGQSVCPQRDKHSSRASTSTFRKSSQSEEDGSLMTTMPQTRFQTMSAGGSFQEEYIYLGNLDDVHSKLAVKKYMRTWGKWQFEGNQQEKKILQTQELLLPKSSF